MPNLPFESLRRAVAPILGVLLLSLGCLAAGTAGGAVGTHAHAGIVVRLRGPRSNLLLNTKYTYRVEVVSNTTYRYGGLSFAVPPSHCVVQRHLTLIAHRPWQGTFTVEFVTTNAITEGLRLRAVAAPPRGGYRPLFNKRYPVTLAPGQAASPVQAQGCPLPGSFGS